MTKVVEWLPSAGHPDVPMSLLRDAVEDAPYAFLIAESTPLELPWLRIVYVNQAFERMTGHHRANVLGQTLEILHGPRTERHILDRIRTALEAGAPVSEELIHYREDGSEMSVELSLVPLRDQLGSHTHWVGVQRDVSAQRAIRDRLTAGESRLDFLAGSMRQLLWTAAPDGSCTFVSQSCAEFLGVPAEDCVQNGWHHFIHPDDAPLAGQTWQESLASGSTFTSEYRLRRHDGEYVWFLHRGVPRTGELGEVLEWIGSSTDIAQHKRSEEAIRQTEKLAAVGRLASSIAHEINNPLASVTNLLYLLSTQRSLDRTAREYVKAAQDEIARVSEITTQTLRFHNQSTAPVPTRLSEVLDAVLALYRPRTSACGMEVRREYERIPQITCLSGDIRQVFANIIGNAVDACPSGGRLRVRLRSSYNWKRQQRGGLRVTIADTGHGIEPENIRRVFDAFYTTKGITGTGLGLWITRDLVTRHDGTIDLRSSARPGRSGTTVSIFLPFEGPFV